MCNYNRELIADSLPHQCVEKIHIIHPFLNLALFTPTSEEFSNPPSNSLRIATVCRLVEKKGLDILIESVASLGQKEIPVSVKIAGDGPERSRLKALIKSRGLEHHIDLLGIRTADQVRELLANSDCFVLPSVPAASNDADATPTVLGEAMAMNLPVISTHLNGIPEIVPPEAGLLVAPGDSEALSAAIATLTAMSPTERSEMGAHGRAFVQAHWNNDFSANKLLGLFRQSVAGQLLPSNVSVQI